MFDSLERGTLVLSVAFHSQSAVLIELSMIDRCCHRVGRDELSLVVVFVHVVFVAVADRIEGVAVVVVGNVVQGSTADDAGAADGVGVGDDEAGVTVEGVEREKEQMQ